MSPCSAPAPAALCANCADCDCAETIAALESKSEVPMGDFDSAPAPPDGPCANCGNCDCTCAPIGYNDPRLAPAGRIGRIACADWARPMCHAQGCVSDCAATLCVDCARRIHGTKQLERIASALERIATTIERNTK